MANYRKGRINDEMAKELAMAMRTVKDPRVSDAFVSVTAVDVTADLKYAKVYYSFLRGDKKEIAQGLKSSAGFLRRHIAQKMNLRVTPELSFIFDDSITYGAHINGLLNKIEFAPEEETTEDSEN